MNKIFNIDLILKEEKESYQPLTWQEMDSNMKILQNTINKL